MPNVILLVTFGLFLLDCIIGVEVPPGFICTGYVADLCKNGNNGGCGAKHCTFELLDDVTCSCDGFDAANENNLLARHKPVKMSGQYVCSRGYCFPGSKVVDGTYQPHGMDEYSSIAITRRQLNAWMQIDLESSHCISAVKIWNRAAYPDRFQNALITIGETEAEVDTGLTDAPVVCKYLPGNQGNVTRYDCNSRMYGRYIRVTNLYHYDYLNLYEIEVIGF